MSELFPFKPLADGMRDNEIERMKLEFSKSLALAQQRAHELDQLLSGSRASVRETEIKHHAKVFEEEATEHRTLALWCLGFALASVGLLIGVAIAFFARPIDLEASVIGQILARLTLLSIPATGLGVAVRQYSVARHNWVVARHRSNALGSYVAFALAIQDTAKDALLTQALSLIFSPQPTGYSKAAASDSIAPFTELVKQFGAGKS